MAEEPPLSLLPIELLPDILDHLRYEFKTLSELCLVSKAFLHSAQPLLFSWIRLREVRWVGKVLLLLAGSPKLCGYLRKLEVRAWPLASTGLDELEDAAIRVLQQATSLQTLHWTRKGSLSDRMVDAICRCPCVAELELGGSSTAWSADQLCAIASPLITLSLILPDRPVLALLRSIVSRLPHLRDLSILCMHVNHYNKADAIELSQALHQTDLRSLALAGLPRISDEGIMNLLGGLPSLRYLALESCTVHPTTWSRLADRRTLPHLRGLKTTHPGPRHEAEALFWPSIERLCEVSAELESLCVYASGQAVASDGKRIWTYLPPSLGATLASRRGAPMKRLEIHSILCPLAVLADFARLTSLRDLTVHIYEKDVAAMTEVVSSLRDLRTLHILAQRADITPDDILGMVQSCSQTLQQVGLRNRVWTVSRTPVQGPWDSHAEPPVSVTLERYRLPFWPEALLVVRT